MNSEKLLIEWPEYLRDIEDLTEKVKDLHEIKKFTCIITIARGGLIPAQYIAYQLEVKQIYSFGLFSYNKNDSSDIWIYQTVKTLNQLQNYLIVDDIYDSGKTIQYLQEKFLYLPEESVTYSCIYLKEKPKYTFFFPKQFIYARKLPNVWIRFPYDLK